ncbi:Sorting nexin-14, partial [Xenoophorus captivus]
LFNELYRNNANLSDGPERKHNSNCFVEMMAVDGMYDYMMYVGRVVFRIPDWLHHILAAGRILFKNTFEAYMDQYMQSKLEAIVQEHRVVSLITQLRGTTLRNLQTLQQKFSSGVGQNETNRRKLHAHHNKPQGVTGGP